MTTNNDSSPSGAAGPEAIIDTTARHDTLFNSSANENSTSTVHGQDHEKLSAANQSDRLPTTARLVIRIPINFAHVVRFVPNINK